MKYLTICFILFFSTSIIWAQTTTKYAMVIHGGAGVMDQKSMTPEIQSMYLNVLNRVLSVGDSVLSHGGTSMDAVEKAIVIMEDSPLFNAGKGAVFTHDSLVELDASVMEGQSLKAGAIAAVRDIKNPISVARAVMEKSEHVLLNGLGASQFAKEQGFEPVDNSYFYTEKRRKSLQELLKQERKATTNDKHGTVGCVALDSYGNIAAGTSTGGMTNKKYGRIGDSPIIGAGTYANNETGGFSCTGHGEYYIRLGFSRDISALMEYKKLSVQEACREEVGKLTKLGGTGGVIGLDKNGNIAMEFNTEGMFRGYIKSGGEKGVAIFK
ncbi:isoaspartyl aminopeptidase [Aquipluma nitroreducens]|uniref:Isoaspartyl peptidase n=1 Tax=Aquipluma nitroreducens TaxID=2010828 RepID=A0A5K7S558_9BACT|nr:isoaspartyl peptidase/L-asparaginase [Aquipluma nitroreducens]BBE16672.1 isoaspartyl aminopeptidase [Aquipluma nitroreducens]